MLMDSALPIEILACLKRALDEDIGPGDVTTDSIVPLEATLRGEIIAKQQGVVAGFDVARQIFLLLDRRIDFTVNVAEGGQVATGTVLANLSGSARALLTGERTALNFLGRMSGIGAQTGQFDYALSGI